MKISKDEFLVIDLDILSEEVEKQLYYRHAVIYYEPFLYFNPNLKLTKQKKFIELENLIINIFEKLSKNYWPCTVILPNSEKSILVDFENLKLLITLGLREMDIIYFNASNKLNFILKGIPCVFHIGFDLKIVVYFTNKSAIVHEVLDLFILNGFKIE